MNPFLLFGGVFLIAVVIAAFITRFQETKDARRSAEERKRKHELATRSAERNRKIMQWLSGIVACGLVITGIAVWFSEKKGSGFSILFYFGGAAAPFMVLWAKTQDDGINPQLRKRPNQTPEATPGRSQF